jgi:hypothetical protein
MEPIVICALVIVIYCGYQTVKDIVEDLRQEYSFERPLLSSRILTRSLESDPVRLTFTKGVLRGAGVLNRSLTLSGCSPALSHLGQQLANERRYR